MEILRGIENVVCIDQQLKKKFLNNDNILDWVDSKSSENSQKRGVSVEEFGAMWNGFLGLVWWKFQRHAIRALGNSPGQRLRQPSGLIFEAQNENCWLGFGFETRKATIMTVRKIELLVDL